MVVQRLRPEGLVHSPAFSHVAVIPPDATIIHVGGQNAVDVDGNLVGGADVAAQTLQCMHNVRIALEAADATIDDVVQWNVLFVDGVDLQAAYEAAGPVFASREPGLVTSARVTGLGVPGALVEIAAVAAIVH